MKRALLLHVVVVLAGTAFHRVDAAGQNPSSNAVAEKPETLIREATEEIRSGDIGGAEGQLRAAIKMGTRDPQAYNLIGFICEQTGRSDEALRHYQHALLLSPTFYPARNNLGSFYLRQGKLALALSEFRMTLKLAPDNATANYNTGIIQAQQGSLAAARDSFQKAHKTDPNDPGILYELAGVQSKLGDTAAARATIEEAHRLAPNQPLIVTRLAVSQIDADSFPEALSSFESVLNLLRQNPAPKSIETTITVEATNALSRVPKTSSVSDKATFLKSEFQFVGKEYPKVLQTLATIPESSRNVDYFDLLGLSLAATGKFPDAVTALAHAIELDPSRSDLLFHMGSVYQRAGDNENAIMIFNRAIAAGDISPETQIALALSYFNLARYDQAIDACRRAIAASAPSYQAYLLMGRSYVQLASTQEAITALRTSTELNPACEECYLQLALALLGHEEDSEAIRLLKLVIQMNPSNASAHYLLGKTFAGMHEYVQAERELQTAVTLEPKSDQAYYQLGRLYLSMGQKAKALTYLNKVQELKEQRSKTSQELVSGAK